MESVTCQALLNLCPARIMWNAYLRIIGILILMKQWAACSSSRALRRSDSCIQQPHTVSNTTVQVWLLYTATTHSQQYNCAGLTLVYSNHTQSAIQLRRSDSCIQQPHTVSNTAAQVWLLYTATTHSQQYICAGLTPVYSNHTQSAIQLPSVTSPRKVKVTRVRRLVGV